ncbi:hypothetical protein P43SY_004582 [Pythium insidiosum]|uniref:Uncharacterized protein n=1 Tax=Pythium insidiosum TaxID=114742 RepID=A0AAD5LED9_PYTIN|nr:hypothetical protein P43SY_004582 [Pythium insidiosum]
MATSELAAILARRRAKAGDAESSNEAPAIERSTPETPNAVPTPAPRASIAERIARLQQQSAAAGPAPTPVPIPIHTSHTSAPSPPAPTTTWPTPTPSTDVPLVSDATPPVSSSIEEPVAASDDAAAGGSRRTSGRIQQLQGSLGINVNPFRPGGPPGGFRKPSTGGGSSIMTTGDQYEHHHMGVPMPGMGAAIPMPGLAKVGMRIPGMAVDGAEKQEEEAAASASLEASHGQSAVHRHAHRLALFACPVWRQNQWQQRLL